MWLLLIGWLRRIKVETVAWIALVLGGLLVANKLRNQNKQLRHAEDTIESLHNTVHVEKGKTLSALELVDLHNKREDALRAANDAAAKERAVLEHRQALQLQKLGTKLTILESAPVSPAGVADAINKLREAQ
jgi:hypothetical protein